MFAFFGKLWDFIVDKNNQRFVLFAIALVFLFLWIQSCRRTDELKDTIRKNESLNQQNISALTDQIRTERNKADQAVSVSTSYVMTIEQLKKAKASLAKELEKANGEIKALGEAVTSGNNASKDKPIEIFTNKLVKYGNGIYGIQWWDKIDTLNYFRYLEAESLINVTKNDSTKEITINPYKTKLYADSSKMVIYVSVRYNLENSKLEWTSRTDYPKLYTSVIGNVDKDLYEKIISKPIKQSDWGLGIFGGIGGATTFNLSNGNGGFVVGLGIYYSLWAW